MEMSRPDRAFDMLSKLKEEPVGYHRFMLKYKKSKRDPICLVEGEDSKYYRVRIKSICDGKEPSFVICGGKKGVIETYESIKGVTEYNNCKLMVFVDKDFDDPLNNTDIYETPCYSIENLYTTIGAFKSILTDELKIDEDSDKDDYSTCIELFVRNQFSFHSAATELNAWIACQRDLSRSGIASRLNLNNKENELMDRFFNVGVDQTSKVYSIRDIENIFPQARKISEGLLNDGL